MIRISISVTITAATFKEAVLAFERQVIREALTQENGAVTRTAKALGTSHQNLCYIINARHPELLAERSPVKKRNKSIIKQRTKPNRNFRHHD